MVTSATALTVTGQRRDNGTPVELWDCNGQDNQKWVQQPDGTLKSVQSGRCLDDPAWKADNGTQLDIWDCDGGANQKWTQPS